MALNNHLKIGTLGLPEWHGTSIQDFDEWCNMMGRLPGTSLFRGQRKYWPLLPRVINNAKRGTILENEKNLLNLFKKEAEPCLHIAPSSDWDWLVVAQHHGLPTRLLDWSYDPYVALWFALEKYEKDGSKPEVWVLNAEKNDTITTTKNTRPFQGSRTKVFQPSFNIPRVRAQKGCFTLFKHVNRSDKGFVALERNKILRKRLQRFRVASYACEDMKTWLFNNGYTHSSIYPNINEAAERAKKLNQSITKPYSGRAKGARR